MINDCNLTRKVTPGLIGKVVIFVLLLLAACLPRLLDLDHPSFTYDEMGDYLSSIRYCGHMDLRIPVYEGYLNAQLPYTIACLFYKLLGTNERVARFVSVVFSLLAICLTFLISRKLFGYWWAVFTAAMLSFSPFYISCSRLAFTHGHSFSLPFILLGLYVFLKINYRCLKSVYLNTGLLGFSLGLALGGDLLAVFWCITFFIALLYAGRKAPRQARANTIAIFLCSACAGFFIASAMYILHPLDAFRYYTEYFRKWDGLKGYLWLGSRVERIPANYYLVVMFVKFTPLVACVGFAAFIFAFFQRNPPGRFFRFLAFSFWPLVFLSLRPWKTPYYVTLFIPGFFILITYGMVRIYKMRFFARHFYLKILPIITLLVLQVYAVLQIHPDYLMQGIQYGSKFYGEFQGPAVSHAQWIGEALEFIQQDSKGKKPSVLIFNDIGGSLIDYYSQRYGIKDITRTVPEIKDEDSPGYQANIDYIVLNQDAKRMYSPYHRYTIEKNKKLAEFVEKTTKYKVVKTFFSGNFPMVWVYKRIP